MDVVHRTKDAIYFGWNDIKWYETYDGVFPIMSGLKNLQENQYSYRYMRIGEDYGDVDEYFFDEKEWWKYRSWISINDQKVWWQVCISIHEQIKRTGTMKKGCE